MKNFDPSAYYIYETRDLTNNKVYIGYHRLNTKSGINYYGSGKQLKQEINSKGWQNFTNNIIDWYDNEYDALYAESYWIYFYMSFTEVYNYPHTLIDIDKVNVWLQDFITKSFDNEN